MPSEAQPQRIYWDACNFLSYINGTSGRLPTLDALFAKASKRDGLVIVTSTLSVTEVAYGQLEQTGSVLPPEIEEAIDALWADQSAVTLVECHELIARRARELRRLAIGRDWSLKTFDAVHLATAEWVRAAEVQTYDAKLPRFASDIGMPVREPFITQPRLME